MNEAKDASQEPIEVKLIAAAMHPGMIVVTPEKCEAIRKLLANYAPPAPPKEKGEPPLRCQKRHDETGQCELRGGHEGKHLAGYLMWFTPKDVEDHYESGSWDVILEQRTLAAYQCGAEAMREAAALRISGRYDNDELADEIRALPLPKEPK